MDHFHESKENLVKHKPIRCPIILEKRKCVVFLVLVILLSLAVIAGAMFSSGRRGNITKYSHGIPATINTNTSCSRTHVASTPAPIVYVPDTFEIKFEIDSIQFTPSLADHASEEFKFVTRVLEERLRAAISYKYDEHFTLKLIKFESSSTNATNSTVRIRWRLEEYDKRTKIPTVKDIIEQIEQYIDVRGGYLGEHQHIRSKSINVEKLIDECHDKTRTSCSHICDFQITTLMFKCSCPDNLILQNESQCVDKDSVKPTVKPKTVNITELLVKAGVVGGVVSDIRYESKATTTTTTKPNSLRPSTLSINTASSNETISKTPISIDPNNNGPRMEDNIYSNKNDTNLEEIQLPGTRREHIIYSSKNDTNLEEIQLPGTRREDIALFT